MKSHEALRAQVERRQVSQKEMVEEDEGEMSLMGSKRFQT